MACRSSASHPTSRACGQPLRSGSKRDPAQERLWPSGWSTVSRKSTFTPRTSLDSTNTRRRARTCAREPARDSTRPMASSTRASSGRLTATSAWRPSTCANGSLARCSSRLPGGKGLSGTSPTPPCSRSSATASPGGRWGPKAREVLAGATSDDVTNEGFKFGTCRMLEIGTQRVLASRISYVGDLGWELYVPIEQGLKLWDTLWEAGRPHGLAACGIGVYGTTGRLEKSYRAHGNELETEYNVVEAGMAAPRVKEEDFIGKAAHMRHREEEPAAILCSLTVDDHRSKGGEKRYMLGREPILTRDGKRIVDRLGRGSYVTSARAGPSVGKHILMAYLTPAEAVVGNRLLVEYMAEAYPVPVAA